MHKDYFPRKANALEGIILVRKNISTTLRNYSTRKGTMYMHFAFIKQSIYLVLLPITSLIDWLVVMKKTSN